MWIKRILMFVILFLLAIPAVQKHFNPIKSKPLSGVFTTMPKPAFSCSTFMTGAYQEKYRQYLEDSVGFKADFVRCYNQVDFSLFSMAHAERVVVGRHNELFAAEYIRGYLGQNFNGEHYIDEKVRMLKFVQDYLWEKKRILLVVLVPPDKGSFYPELIPDRFLKMKRHQTGRDYFTGKANVAGINLLDFNPYFIAIKDTSRYRLIPPTGVHWSDYGAYLAADSAIRYFESKTGLKFPRMVVDSMETTMHPRHNDDDINKAMNLIWDAPHEKLAYPCFRFITDTTQPKPAALFIADSFIWNWWDQPVIQGLFRNQEIWYYDKEVYPESFTKMKYTWEVNLREAVERQNFVILFQVGAGSGDPGAGVIDRLYAEYDTSSNNLIRRIEKNILSDPAWLALENGKARDNNLPVAEILRRDAINLFNSELRKKK